MAPYILADFKPLGLAGVGTVHGLPVPKDRRNPVGNQELVKMNAI